MNHDLVMRIFVSSLVKQAALDDSEAQRLLSALENDLEHNPAMPALGEYQDLSKDGDIQVFIRIAEVSRLVGLSRSGIYKYIRQGNFPPPIKIGPRVSVWTLRKILDWQNEQIKSSCQYQPIESRRITTDLNEIASHESL